MINLNQIIISSLRERKEDKNSPFLFYGEKSFSINQIIDNIEQETEVGEMIVQGYVALTIDLVQRGKEKLK